MKRILSLIAIYALSSAAFAEAPTPEYSLLGDVVQTVKASASDWSEPASLSWTLSADLNQKFALGPVTFAVDSTATVLPGLAQGTANFQWTVYEAYLRLTPIDGLDLVAGQKRFNVGVGQTFTVGDSVNPWVGFFDQKTGFRGATIVWSPTSALSWSAAVSAERNLGVDRWFPTATQASTTIDGSELAYATQIAALIDTLQVTASLSASPDRSFNPAIGLSYDLGGWILTAEGAAEFLPQAVRPSGTAVATWKKPAEGFAALSGIFGARYTLGFEDVDFTLSGEYLYWAQGWTAAEQQTWKDTLAAFPAQAATVQALRKTLPIVGQHEVFFKASIAAADTATLSALWIVDVLDASSLAQVSLAVQTFEGLDLIGAFQGAWGASNSVWEKLGPTTKYAVQLQTKYHF